MKSFFSIVSCMLLGLNLPAQEDVLPAFQSQGSDVFILDSLYNWGWDSLSADWYLRNRTNYTYDENQNTTAETESAYDIIQGWYDSQRSLNTYDGENRLTSVTDQDWDGNAWVNVD